MKSTILITIILALVPASFASGQFVLDSLPKPGQWARYDAITTSSDSPDMQIEWSYFIRCLADEGNTEPDSCWIELEIHLNDGCIKIHKMLIPKSEFRTGGEPLKHLIRGWVFLKPGTNTDNSERERWSDGKPKPITDDEIKNLGNQWLIGIPDNAEQLMGDYVEANGQTFRCSGFAFSRRWLQQHNVELAVQYEIRVSPNVPFGLVSSETTTMPIIDGNETFTYSKKSSLTVSCDDALSALPDSK